MPGRRNLARELAQHAVEHPGRLATIHAQLRSQLPAEDRVLIGSGAILGYLSRVLCLRLPSGRSLAWHTVKRWRRDLACPILRGGWNPRRQSLAPPVSTAFALTAWTLAQFDAAGRAPLFTVFASHAPVFDRGKAPKKSDSAQRKKLAA